MPRRRGARLTASPKKKAASKAGGDPTAPTAEQWNSMRQFGSFIVRDEDDEEYTFRKGDVATILPHGVSPGAKIELCDYWVAKIREIRANSDDNVWTRVQWYWSGLDVKSAVKSFKPEACGRYERIFSDHYDFVSTSAYDAVIQLARFSENDPDQPLIGRQTFYQRYTFEFLARTIEPKQGSATCLCSEPYNPNEPSSSEVMHFCPRPACRKWYHSSCLLAHRDGNSDGQHSNEVSKTRGGGAGSRKRTRSQMEAKETSASESKESDRPHSLKLLCSSPDLDGDIDVVALVGGRLPSAQDEEDEEEEDESSSARQVELAILAEVDDSLSARSLLVSGPKSRSKRKSTSKEEDNEQLANTWVKRLRSQKENAPTESASRAPTRSQRTTTKVGPPTRSTRASVAAVAAQKGKKKAPAPIPKRTTRSNATAAVANQPSISADAPGTASVAPRRRVVAAEPENPLMTPPPDADVQLTPRRENVSAKAKGKVPQKPRQITPAEVIEYYSQPGSAWNDGVDETPLLPQALLKIAEQPILRGLAYEDGGVSGNVSIVVKARRRVYQLLNWVGRGRPMDGEDDDMVDRQEKEAQSCPTSEAERDNWETRMVRWGMDKDLDLEDCFDDIGSEKKGKTAKKAKKQTKVKRNEFCCPQCKGAI